MVAEAPIYIVPKVEQQYFTTPDAAKYLGISVPHLERMRRLGEGPRFSKRGPRLVLYRRIDLDAWVEERMVSNTTAGRALVEGGAA